MKRLALVIGGLVMASSVTAVAQGIGDAAKKERARRTTAPAKEPAKVYVIDGSTSSDKNATSEEASPRSKSTGTAGESAGAAGPLSSGATDSSGRNESYWRGRYASAQRAIDAADQRVKDLEAEVGRYGPVVPGPNVGCYTAGCDGSAMWIQAGQEALGRLNAAKARAAAARKAMDDLQEEARRAGALPGWLR